MAQKCYVKVYDGNTQKTYDVGPFDYSGNQVYTPANNSAINWIYKQIGIVKTQHPEAHLIKHKWSYITDAFLDSEAEVKVEINNILFEIFILTSPDTKNVINEKMHHEHPEWVENQSHDSNDNTKSF